MHTIKPEHCIIGSNGHCVQPIINAALQTWITQRMRKVNYTYKGTNVLADFTSVFKGSCTFLMPPLSLSHSHSLSLLDDNTNTHFESCNHHHLTTADVPVPDEPDTEIDPVLIQRLSVAKRLFICGQSLSHTINFSIKDLLQYWPHKANVITILKDCCSVNTDLQPDLFDKANFFKDMKKVGVSVQYSREAFLETEET
jgi:nicotinamidase/pyrazinamidase